MRSTREIVLVGLGPGPLDLLTREAQDVLLDAERVLLRLTVDPIYDWLVANGRTVIGLDGLYYLPRIGYEDVYATITDAVLTEARNHGRAVYAVPGHPFVAEIPSTLIAERAAAEHIALRVVPGLSYVEVVYATLCIDPLHGMQLASAYDFGAPSLAFTTRLPMIVGCVFGRQTPDGGRETRQVGVVAQWLRERLPADHPVSLVWTSVRPSFRTSSATFPLAELEDRAAATGGMATLYVPAGRD